MHTPDHLKYAPSHEWLHLETDGSATIGITDHAQEALGDIVFLELPTPGRIVKAGEACAVVESVKAASDIYAPVSGEIIAINEAVIEAPETVNQDAYAAWFFKIKLSQPDEIKSLLDAPTYSQVAAAG